MSDSTVQVVTGSQLLEPQFSAVQRLIIEGGEVRSSHLAEYLRSAHRIALIEINGELACVGAVKAARSGYIQSISGKSAYPLEAENCVGEFGYVVTRAAFRKQGLARTLSAKLLKDFEGSLYATTRDDNTGIHLIVKENGFEVVGGRWRSVEHPGSSLMLWLKR